MGIPYHLSANFGVWWRKYTKGRFIYYFLASETKSLQKWEREELLWPTVLRGCTMVVSQPCDLGQNHDKESLWQRQLFISWWNKHVPNALFPPAKPLADVSRTCHDSVTREPSMSWHKTYHTKITAARQVWCYQNTHSACFCSSWTNSVLCHFKTYTKYTVSQV